MESRNRDIDTISGLMMFHVLFLHLTCTISGKFSYAINDVFIELTCFAMPWFFFKSGLINKDDAISVAKFKKMFRRLIVPWLFSVAVLFVFYTINSKSYLLLDICVYIKHCLFYGFPPNHAYPWFLLSLFIVKLHIGFCKYIQNKYKIGGGKLYLIYCLSAIVGLSIYCLTFVFSIRIPLWIASSGLGIFFYTIGIWFSNYPQKSFIAIFSLIAYLLVFCFMPSFDSMPYDRVIYGNYFVGILVSVIGVLSISLVIQQLKKLLPLAVLGFLAYIGEHSMSLYLIHWPLWLFISRFVSFSYVNYAYIILLLVAFPYIVSIVKRNNVLSFIFGEKI